MWILSTKSVVWVVTLWFLPLLPSLLATFLPCFQFALLFCQFNCLQTIVFPQVSIWCKQGIFGRKVLLGEVRIALGALNLSVKQVSWYKLFIDSQLSEWWLICREPKPILWRFYFQLAFSNWPKGWQIVLFPQILNPFQSEEKGFIDVRWQR